MTPKKVLLTAINSKFTHINPVPFYLREALNGCNCTVEILQLNINQNYMELLSNLMESKAEVLGFSVYIWNSQLIKQLVLDIKKVFPQVVIVVGGPEAGYNPDWLNYSDYIVKGAGEVPFKKFAENNFSSKEKVLENKFVDFNLVNFPYTDDDILLFENKYIYYEASRGCPYRCSYCLSSREDQRIQFRDLEKVFGELDFLIKSNCKVVKFVDRSFNCNKEFSRGIWKYLIKNYKENVKFHFEIYPVLLEDEDFEILQKIPRNYFQFEIGIQSVNTKTLKEIRRFENPEKVRQNVKRLQEIENLHIHLDLIVGLPFEGIKEVEKSFNEIYEMKGDHFQLGFLKILPGTELEENVEKYGTLSMDCPPYEILKSKWLSFDEIDNLRGVENVLEIFSNSHKFENTVKKMLSLFSSPFQMFYEIQKFSKEQYGLTDIKGQEAIFRLLYNFNLQFQRKEWQLLINDCLRLDWFQCGNFVNVPSFLRTGNEGCRNLPDFIKKHIKLNIKSCGQRAYVQLKSLEVIKEFGGNPYVFYYKDEDKVVKKVYLLEN